VLSDKDYTNIKKVYQINLNGYDEFKRNEFIYRSKVIEEKYNIERYDNLEIMILIFTNFMKWIII